MFDPDDIDHTWAGDVTYVPTYEGWLYLASVLDLGSRRLLSYAMSPTADTDHVINAVRMAVTTRGRERMNGTIFHPDRGRPTPPRATVPPVSGWACGSRPAGPGRA